MGTTASTAASSRCSRAPARPRDAASRTKERAATMTDDDPKNDIASPASQGSDRRSHDRFDVTWSVDCVADDTFLYASIANISQMGIFVRTIEPLEIGTRDRKSTR